MNIPVNPFFCGKPKSCLRAVFPETIQILQNFSILRIFPKQGIVMDLFETVAALINRHGKFKYWLLNYYYFYLFYNPHFYILRFFLAPALSTILFYVL